MFALDLFNTKYERKLQEGAVDSPEATQDECMGYGGLVGEGADDIEDRGEYDQEGDMLKDNLHTIRREAARLEKIIANNENVPEWVQDKLAQVKGMITASSEYMQTQRERDHEEASGEEGVTIAEQDEELARQELGDGFGVYQEMLKAWNEKKPFVKVSMPDGEWLTISRPHIFNVLYALKNMNDNAFKKTVANAFSTLAKFMIWSNSIKRYNLPAEKPQPAPGGIAPGGKQMVQQPLIKERSNQKKNSKDLDAPQSPEVQRYLTKVRNAAPNATSDVEAIAKDELAKQARVSKNLSDLERVNAQQDAALKRSMALDREQDNEINNIESQLDRLAQRIQSVKAGKPSASATTSAWAVVKAMCRLAPARRNA